MLTAPGVAWLWGVACGYLVAAGVVWTVVVPVRRARRRALVALSEALQGHDDPVVTKALERVRDHA